MLFSFVAHLLIRFLVWFLLLFVFFSWVNRSARKTIDRAAQEERDEEATLREIAILKHNRDYGPAWARERSSTEP